MIPQEELAQVLQDYLDDRALNQDFEDFIRDKGYTPVEFGLKAMDDE